MIGETLLLKACMGLINSMELIIHTTKITSDISSMILPTIGCWPLSTLHVAPPHGDGQHRRYMQRGIRRAGWHVKVGGALFYKTYFSRECVRVTLCARRHCSSGGRKQEWGRSSQIFLKEANEASDHSYKSDDKRSQGKNIREETGRKKRPVSEEKRFNCLL
jgi:hypothetical protein